MMGTYLKMCSLRRGVLRSSWCHRDFRPPWLKYPLGELVKPSIGGLFVFEDTCNGFHNSWCVHSRTTLKVLVRGEGTPLPEQPTRQLASDCVTVCEVGAFWEKRWNQFRGAVGLIHSVLDYSVVLASFTPRTVVGVAFGRETGPIREADILTILGPNARGDLSLASRDLLASAYEHGGGYPAAVVGFGKEVRYQDWMGIEGE